MAINGGAGKGKRRRVSPSLMALEPRWVYDGAAGVTHAHAATGAAAQALIPVVPTPVEVQAANPARDNGKTEAVFVDTSVSDWRALVAGIEKTNPGAELNLIEGGSSGLAQVATWAESHSGYDAIHIVSDGAEGKITIGSDTVTDASLSSAATKAELAEIGSALKTGGELAFYGSSIGAGTDGQQLITDLAADTGAVVVAADHTMGHSASALDLSTGTATVSPLDISGYLGTLDIGAHVTDSDASAIEVQAANATLDGNLLEVAFVDTSVADWATLVSSLQASRPGIGIELIDGTQSGLAQIADWASSHSGYDAIHILSHGADGVLSLGTDTMTDATLSGLTAKAELAIIGGALKSSGDLLIYGCDVADGSRGAQFVTALAADVGHVVAASTDDTGAASQGGDWVLEASTGHVAVAALNLPGYDGLLSDLSASGFSTSLTITNGQTTSPFSTVVITDNIGGDIPSATISFAAADGTLSGTGLSAGTTSNGTITYTLTAASTTALQSDLQALVFTPAKAATVDFTLTLASSNMAALPSGGTTMASSVAVDSSGNIYLAGGPNGVQEIVKANGATITLTSSNSNGVAVDSSDNVYYTAAGAIKEIVKANQATLTLATGVAGATLAVDSAGDVFFLSTSDKKVREVVKANGAVVTLNIATANPASLGVDSGGDVFVSDLNHGTVVELVAANSASVTVASGLLAPYGVTVDSAGDVFIADSGSKEILEIVKSNGAIVTLGTQLAVPVAVAVDSVGDVFFISASASAVEMLITPLTFSDATTQVTVTPPPPVISSVSYDASTGQITLSGSYFTTSGSDYTFTDLTLTGDKGTPYTLTGGTLDSASTASTVIIDLNAADKTALLGLFDKDGGQGANGTTAYNLAATTGWDTGAAAIATQAMTAKNLPMTADGFTTSTTITTFQTTSPFSTVTITDPIGGDIPSATISFTAADGTLSGTGLSAGSTSGGIITYTLTASSAATLQSELRALVFTPASVSTSTNVGFTLGLASNPLSTIESNVLDPADIAIDSAGDIFYIMDSTMVKEYVKATGATLTLSSAYMIIGDLSRDSAGNIFFLDDMAGKVLEIVKANSALLTFATGLSSPQGMTVDNAGDVFFTDGSNLIEIAAGSTTQTTLASGFSSSAGVTTDSAGNVFVADSGSGNVWELVKANAWAKVSVGSGWSAPSYVAVDSAGDVFVTDPIHGLVCEVVKANSAVVTLSAAIDSPMGVAVDSAGDVFVASGTSNGSIVEIGVPLTFRDTTTQVTEEPPPPPVISSVSYDASTGQMTLSGVNFTTTSSDYTFTGLTLTGDRGATYTLTGGTLDGASSASKVIIDLNAADKTALLGLFDKDGVQGANGTTAYNLAVTTGWDTGAAAIATQAVTALNLPMTADGFTTSTTINAGQTTSPFSTVVITDPIGGDSPSATISLDAADGTLSGTGLSAGTTSNGTITYTLTATSAATLQSELRALVFTPASVNTSTNVGFTLGLTSSTASATIVSGINSANAIAVDGAGDIFYADGRTTIKEYVKATGATLTLATGFTGIDGLSLDSAGNLFIADYGAGKILEIVEANSTTRTLASGLNSPFSVAVDNDGDLFFTAYSGGSKLMEIVTGTTTPITLAGGFQMAYDVVTDSAGDVFVADGNGGKVWEFVKANAWTKVAVGSGWTAPNNIAVDSAGNVFVADYLADTLCEVVKANGAILTLITGLASPGNIGLDAAGDVFVTNYGSGGSTGYITGVSSAPLTFSDATTQVTVTPVPTISSVSYDASTGQITLSGMNFTTSGSDYTFTDLTLTGDKGATYTLTGGTLDAASTSNKVIIDLNAADKTALLGLFDLDGKQGANGTTAYNLAVTTGWDTGAGAVATRAMTAKNLPMTATGFTTDGVVNISQGGAPFSNVTISDPISGNAPTATISFDSSFGTLSGTGLSAGTTSGSTISYTLTASSAAALQSELRALHFAPSKLATVDFTLSLDSGNMAVLGSGFGMPLSTAMDSDGNIYVADGSGVQEVVKANGATISLTSAVSNGVAVDSSGNVYYTDVRANALKEIVKANQVTMTLATGIAGTDVAVDSAGDVFFNSNTDTKVREFVKANNTVITLNIAAASPVGIAVDSAGDVFVTDNDNNTVVELVAANSASVTVASGLSSPWGVAVDSAGDVFVADGSRILEIVKSNGATVTLGTKIPSPTGIAVDSAGDVFFTSYGKGTAAMLVTPVTFSDATTQITVTPFVADKVVPPTPTPTPTPIPTPVTSSAPVGAPPVIVDTMHTIVTESRAPSVLSAEVKTSYGITSPVALASVLSAANEGGYRVAVLADTATRGDAVVPAAPIGDVQLVAGSVSFTVPADAFAVARESDSVSLSATQANGQPLPKWLVFNAKAGVFHGTPPAGEKSIEIKITAKDASGHSATQTFKINTAPVSTSQRNGILQSHWHAGRPGLSAQLHTARHAEPTRMAALVAAARQVARG